jgi:carbamoyl-phosphate synthase large subunit
MSCLSILITSAGRRTSLLKAFLEAAHRRGWRVLAGDLDPLAPALYLADRGLPLPPVLSADYVRTLLELVEQENIRLVVPTIDTELPVLAQNVKAFAVKGCVALVSSSRLIKIAGDKWLTVKSYADAGISTPRSWLPQNVNGNLPENLFLKPRDGSASQHAYAITRSQLARLLGQVPNALIQEKLEGPEITIDALLDLKGQPIHFVPRVRIRTMSGESIQGVTIDDDELRAWLLKILGVTAALGGRGPITLQAFLTPRGPVFSEINPRFGGGFPLTEAAGGHYPDWILRDLEEEKLAPCFGEYRKNLYMTRYYVEHFTEQPLWNSISSMGQPLWK